VIKQVPDLVILTGHLTRYPPGPMPGVPGAWVWDLVFVTTEHCVHQNPHTCTMLEYLLGGPLGLTAPFGHSQTQQCLTTHQPPRTFFTPFGPIHYALCMFISPLVKLSTVPNTYISLGQGKSCSFVQFICKANVERIIEALGSYLMEAVRLT